MNGSERIELALAAIPVLGIAAHWLAWRLRLPAILLLLSVGIAVGPVSGLIDPSAVFGELLLPLVSVSVGLILFEGGLNLRFSDLRDTWRSLLGLLTVGMLTTWLGAALAAHYLLNAPWSVALVLGAILVVTGPTVIGPMLREIRPSARVAALAKWEGIVIDPVGATLAVLVFEAASAIRTAEYGSAGINALRGLASTVLVGVVLGGAAALVLYWVLRRFWVPDHLQNPVTLMLVIVASATGDWLYHESGLLVVTVMGVVLANQRAVDIRRIMEFKESLTILLISTLFIVLSARISVDSLAVLGWRGLPFVLAILLVIRPVSVWLATLRTGISAAERCFLAWFAPRGIVAAAVSSVFALQMGDDGALLVPATFAVIFATVSVYGLTSHRLARRLGLSVEHPSGLLIAGANRVARTIAGALKREGFEVMLVDTRFDQVSKARREGLTAFHGNVLSESVVTAIDFSGIGRFLALTPNAEVNTLAAARFRESFGRENVFQVSTTEPQSADDAAHAAGGRVLFGPEMTYDRLDEALHQGGQIKVTRLSEQFNYEAFQSHYGDLAWPMFVIDGKRLLIGAGDARLTPKPGQSVVSLLLAPLGQEAAN